MHYNIREEGAEASNTCPLCGMKISRVTMKNGGLVSFESAAGLRMVKHACQTIGEHLSQRRDPETEDLFLSYEAAQHT